MRANATGIPARVPDFTRVRNSSRFSCISEPLFQCDQLSSFVLNYILRCHSWGAR